MVDSTIYMAEDLMAQVRQAATAQQRSPDELVRDAVERYLRQQRREKLYAYGEGQAKRLGIKESDVPDLVEQTDGRL